MVSLPPFPHPSLPSSSSLNPHLEKKKFKKSKTPLGEAPRGLKFFGRAREPPRLPLASAQRGRDLRQAAKWCRQRINVHPRLLLPLRPHRRPGLALQQRAQTPLFLVPPRA